MPGQSMLLAGYRKSRQRRLSLNDFLIANHIAVSTLRVAKGLRHLTDCNQERIIEIPDNPKQTCETIEEPAKLLDRSKKIFEIIAHTGQNIIAAPETVPNATMANSSITTTRSQRETHVFPRFKKAGQMVDLVDPLLRQHKAGRSVTQTILRLSPSSRANADDREQLVTSMQSFITMYRPYAAREDTDLFPKLKNVVSPHERCHG